jgi:glycosyltransferase involved in cell wall biosynthesis
MEAYVDARLQQWDDDRIDLIVFRDCAVPEWIRGHDRLRVVRSTATSGEGRTIPRRVFRTVRAYLSRFSPTRLRQVTQPRWHAIGVVAGAATAEVTVETRASRSLFTEYADSADPLRSYVANNVLGRAVFLGERLYTPDYGAVTLPRWSPADRQIERRRVNDDRFSSSVTPGPAFDVSAPHVVTVGRVSKKKGSDLLVPVSERLNDTEFSIVGDSRDDDITDTLRDRPNVTLHGEIDYVEMPRVYAGADALLSVSRVEWGGISRAMLEARSMDVPVVALANGDAGAVAEYTTAPEPAAIADRVVSALDG